MTDHDPRAADVLALSRAHMGRRDRPDLIDLRDAFRALNALAAAGLVVRPADEYERVEWHWADDCCNRPILDGDWPDDPGARPLYVRKENPDD